MIRPKVKWKLDSRKSLKMSPSCSGQPTTASSTLSPAFKKLLVVTLMNLILFFTTVVNAVNHDHTAYSPLPDFPLGRNISNRITPKDMTPVPVPAPRQVRCDEARIKCALRQGCSSALQSYMLDCADLMAGRVTYCDEFCEASLIALTSSEEGEALMNCICSDDYCRRTKERIEVCREGVILAQGKDAIVSCSVAQLICAADTSCSTALTYYERFCKRMFSGRECTFRCNNSISILSRQDKAAKLETCECDGTESFDCFSIKKNMEKLCFAPPKDIDKQKTEEETNQISSSTDEEIKKATSSCATSSILYKKLFTNDLLGLNRVCFGPLFISLLIGLTSSMVVRWNL